MIAEELLLNIMEHAGVKRIRFYCGKSGNDVVLAVWDDGRAFDPTAEQDNGMGSGGEIGITMIRQLAAQWIYTRYQRENCNFIRLSGF